MSESLKLSDTELILNPDNSIYHLGIHPEHVSKTVIVVGDPNRVKDVSKHFDKITFQQEKREFVTHVGTIADKRLTVISSGIGVDNVELLMTELDFLVNFDLKSKTEKIEKTKLSIIRIGTSGSIQESVNVDTFLLSERAIGLDNLFDFYELNQSESFKNIADCFQKEVGLKSKPYLASADEDLLNTFEREIHKGNTITCPGFYAPQGRISNARRSNNLAKQFSLFNLDGFQFDNLEMETAGYYAFGQLFGHKMLSINAILANRITNEFSKNPEIQVEKLIKLTLGLLI